MVTQPKDERQALNCHGVFLKKRVLAALRTMPRMDIIAEEFAVAFNEPVAIDLIATDERDGRRLSFIFECKRAYTTQKTWVFFKDMDSKFRFCRAVSSIMQFGQYAIGKSFAGQPPVCSEGYELVASEKSCKADQHPIFEAGNQLCKGFLGYVQSRMRQKIGQASPPDTLLDCFFPVLVTTADLRIAEFDVSQISLQTRNLDGNLNLIPRDWLILKHPFSVLADTFGDFRNDPSHEQDQRNWSQVHRESLFVVNADKLPTFFNGPFRGNMHDLEMK